MSGFYEVPELHHVRTGVWGDAVIRLGRKIGDGITAPEVSQGRPVAAIASGRSGEAENLPAPNLLPKQSADPMWSSRLHRVLHMGRVHGAEAWGNYVSGPLTSKQVAALKS